MSTCRDWSPESLGLDEDLEQGEPAVHLACRTDRRAVSYSLTYNQHRDHKALKSPLTGG